MADVQENVLINIQSKEDTSAVDRATESVKRLEEAQRRLAQASASYEQIGAGRFSEIRQQGGEQAAELERRRVELTAAGEQVRRLQREVSGITTATQQTAQAQERVTEAVQQTAQAQDRVTEAAQRTATAKERARQWAPAPEDIATMPPESQQQIREAMGTAPPQSLAEELGIPAPSPETTRPTAPSETGLTARERLGEKLRAIGADAEFTTAALKKFDALVEAHIPTEVALGRVIGKTATEFEKLAEAVRKPLTELEKLEGKMERMGVSPRFRAEARARVEELGRADITGEPATRQAIAETLKSFREAEATARRQAIPPEERVRAEAQARGLDPAAETAAVERLNELRAARIPIERAIKQSVNEVESALVKEEAAARKAEAARRETVATQRVLQEAYKQAGLRPIEEKEFPFVEKMEARGIPLENQVKVLDEMKNVMSSSLGPQEAFATAQRNIKRSLDETGESAKTSGNWLSRYIQRYLVRYLVVWQGMRALQSTMRDWVAAHDEMDRALFRSQTSMGLSISQAERYMATMRRMGGEVGLPAAQMAGGAMQLGPTAGMAGQFGAMAGMGGAEGMKFLAGIQKQYALSAEELEELIPRIWAAFAGSGEDIQTFLGHWQDLVNDLGSGSDAVNKWTRDWATYETTSMRATDKVKAAWGDFLIVLGDIQPIVDAKNWLADLFTNLAAGLELGDLPREEHEALYQQYEAETGVSVSPWRRNTPEFQAWWRDKQESETTRPVPEMPAHEEWRLTGKLPGGGEGAIGTQFIDSVQIMTQAQYDQLEAITNQKEEMLTAQGIISSEIREQVAIQTEHGYKFDTLNTTALALLLANEEMNERQKSAVYNMPSGAEGIMMALMGTGTVTSQETGVTRGGGGGAPISFGMFDPANPWGATPNMSTPTGPAYAPPPINPGLEPRNPWIPWIPGGLPYYQSGGAVKETGPAIVHKGEYVLPAGGSSLSNIKLQSNLFIDGTQVSTAVSKVLGDQLLQATRASQGQVGGILAL